MFVWRADQCYPMAMFEQGEGVDVPALAIERTPWGEQPEFENVRLASCTSTGKVCPCPVTMSPWLAAPVVVRFVSSVTMSG